MTRNSKEYAYLIILKCLTYHLKALTLIHQHEPVGSTQTNWICNVYESTGDISKNLVETKVTIEMDILCILADSFSSQSTYNLQFLFLQTVIIFQYYYKQEISV